MSQRRRYERFPIRLPARILRGRQTFEGETVDVSQNGLLIHMEQPPRLRDLVKVEVQLPRETIRVMGMAVHVVPATHSVGVQLWGLEPNARDHWLQFVRMVRSGDIIGLPPAQNLPKPWERAVTGTIKPELRVTLASIADLEQVRSRDIANGSLYVRTEVYLEKGVQVRVVFVHPKTDKTFGFDAVVQDVIRNPAFVGLCLTITSNDANRTAFEDFVNEDVYITIDLDHGDLVDPDVVHGNSEEAEPASG